MTAKQEKVRVNKVSPEDVKDPELREIMNGLVSLINKSRERLEQVQEGNISCTDVKKLAREDDKEYRELNRRLKEYKKKQKGA